MLLSLLSHNNLLKTLIQAIVRSEIAVMNALHHAKLLNLYDAFEDRYEITLVLE